MLRTFIASAALVISAVAHADVEKYTIDTQGAHAFIQFKISHLGFSWLYGRFNEFEGQFEVDPDTHKNAKVSVTINTASIDSNHAERDKHLRSDDFLNVKKHPKATFVSTSSSLNSLGNGTLTGDLTLNGVTKSVVLDVSSMGAGPDPWGSYRRGYSATTEISLSDFNIKYDLGPSSREVELTLSIEGIRQSD